MGQVASFEPLDENKWLRFEEKLLGNFSSIVGDLDPEGEAQRWWWGLRGSDGG